MKAPFAGFSFFINMEKLETIEITEKKNVFFSKYAGKFDTPKKINRSSKSIPENFIDKIENGECNSADIEMLQNIVPVYTYKTCLTIHGNFPDINRTRIGVYKNIIQNQNGSLEIRWSAIDNHKKKQIKEYIRPYSGYNVQENSTSGIYFEKNVVTSNKAEAYKVLAEMKAEAENMNIPGMMAKFYVMGYSYWGRYYITLTILPFKIHGDPLEIAATIVGVNSNEMLETYNARKAEQERKDKEHKEQIDRINNIVEEQMQKALEGIKHLSKTKIEPVPGSVYIVPTVSNSKKPCYRFYKITEKGSFGRVKVETYLAESPEIDNSKFTPLMKGKQLKVSEITTKEVYK